MRVVEFVWAWITATELRAAVALGVAGFLFNAGVRFLASPEWAAFKLRHPRVAGVFLFCKGFFPEGDTMWRGLFAAITGELKARASGAPPKPFPRVPPLPLLCLALALALTGCPKEAKGPAVEATFAALRVTSDVLLDVNRECAAAADAITATAEASTDPATRKALAGKAERIAHDCGVATRQGIAALADGEDALDAYGDATAGRIGCALSRGLDAIKRSESAFLPAGWPDTVRGKHLREEVEAVWRFAGPLVEGLGSSCPLGAPVDGGAS